jgi:K+-transporting ATPase A subunit
LVLIVSWANVAAAKNIARSFFTNAERQSYHCVTPVQNYATRSTFLIFITSMAVLIVSLTVQKGQAQERAVSLGGNHWQIAPRAM